MKLRELCLASAMLLYSSPISENLSNKNIKENLIKVLSENKVKEPIKPVFYKFDVSEKLLDGLDTMEFNETYDIIFRRKISELKQTPLYMNGVSRHTGEFLGYSQYDNILKKYNSDTLNVNESKTISAIGIDTIEYPLIYDELKDKIPADLNTLLAQEKFSKYRDRLQGEETILIITKQNDTRHSIAYYFGGKLFLASYTSIGLKSDWTPQGLFAIDQKIANKRSKKHDNAPMPYALHVYDDIFIHQGKSNGQRKSHGCIRVPGLYQEILYHHAKLGTKVLIIP